MNGTGGKKHSKKNAGPILFSRDFVAKTVNLSQKHKNLQDTGLCHEESCRIVPNFVGAGPHIVEWP